MALTPPWLYCWPFTSQHSCTRVLNKMGLKERLPALGQQMYKVMQREYLMV